MLSASYCNIDVNPLSACLKLNDFIYILLFYNSLSDSRGAGREAGACESGHGNFYHNEPGLCRPFQPTGQSQETVPQSCDDIAWSSTDCTSHAVFAGIPNCWETCQQNCAILHVRISSKFISFYYVGCIYHTFINFCGFYIEVNDNVMYADSFLFFKRTAEAVWCRIELMRWLLVMLFLPNFISGARTVLKFKSCLYVEQCCPTCGPRGDFMWPAIVSHKL